MSMIIAERDTNIIIRTKKDVYEHRPNDSYNKLKYGTFKGNRIFHEWDSETNVVETYNERIFNCICGGERLQLRNANDICKAILDKDQEAFTELFRQNYYNLHKAELIEGLIDNDILMKGRVKRTNNGEFIVDEAFKVDANAITYVLDFHLKANSKRKKKWNHLCTVIKLKNSPREVMTKVGKVAIDSKLQDCISKILCLVQPITWDQTIWNQIPNWIKRIYKDELEAFDKRKELK